MRNLVFSHKAGRWIQLGEQVELWTHSTGTVGQEEPVRGEFKGYDVRGTYYVGEHAYPYQVVTVVIPAS